MPSGIIVNYYLGDQHQIITNDPYDPVYFSVSKFQAPSSYGMWVKWKGSEGAFNSIKVNLKELKELIYATMVNGSNFCGVILDSFQVPKMSRL
jgi:hypothetical protein